MKITKQQDGGTLTIALEGRLDTTTSPELEKELLNLPGVTRLVFDLSELAYISSAGLRVLLMAQKTMNKQGSMIIRNANDAVMDIFDVTGFTDILSIETKD